MIDQRVRIEPSRQWVDRAIEWGRMSVRGYRKGEKERSRQYASDGVDENLDAQAMGKLGEIVFCLWLELDPDKALDWSPRPDRGFDLVYDKARIDVKATNTLSLIWSVTKNELLAEAPIDIFVMVQASERPVMYLGGWCSKKYFLLRHEVAKPRIVDDEEQEMTLSPEIQSWRRLGRGLKPGTKHIPSERLHRMGVFPGRSDDPREHYCWCGEWGSRGNGRTFVCETHTSHLPVGG